MKVPGTVTFTFDPDTSDITALQTFEGRILWACIKTQHIVDEYFNAAVEDVARRLQENMPKTYRGFKDVIRGSDLCQFGTRWVRDSGYTVLDDEFWRGMWRYLKRKNILDIQLEPCREGRSVFGVGCRGVD
jgi:hypothetical protein